MIALVSILPIGKGASLSRHVAEAVDEARKSGLDYRLTAMGTLIEGEWDEVMALIKRMRARVVQKCPRVYVTIAIDDRKGSRRIDAKVSRVERLLSRRGRH